MEPLFTDEQIAALLSEGKPYERSKLSTSHMASVEAYYRSSIEIRGVSGTRFVVFLRRSILDRFNFSAILGVKPEGQSEPFLLRRYNGRSHPHSNPIEGDTFFDYHIHTATERYQRMGRKPEMYAVPTDRYQNLEAAVLCMIEDCGFVSDDDGSELTLWTQPSD